MNVAAILALAISAHGIAAAQVPTVQVEAARDSVRLGEPFALLVTVEGVPAGAQVRFGELADTGTVSALGPPALLPEMSGSVRSARYELAVWELGDVTLPAGTVQVTEDGSESVLVWDELEVHVASLIPADAALDTLAWRPAADVVGPNWSLTEKLLGAAVVVGIVLALLLLARRFGVGQPVPVPGRKPPREQALDALSGLSAAGLAEAGELKAFYSRLARIVRRYLAEIERRWGEDLTTRELVTAFGASEMQGGDVTRVRSLLEEADNVKFARRRPTTERALAALDAARSWVSSFEWPVYREAGPEGVAAKVGEETAGSDVLVALDEVLREPAVEGEGPRDAGQRAEAGNEGAGEG